MLQQTINWGTMRDGSDTKVLVKLLLNFYKHLQCGVGTDPQMLLQPTIILVGTAHDHPVLMQGVSALDHPRRHHSCASTGSRCNAVNRYVANTAIYINGALCSCCNQQAHFQQMCTGQADCRYGMELQRFTIISKGLL